MPVYVNNKTTHDTGYMFKTGEGLGPVAERGTNLGLQHMQQKILVCALGTRCCKRTVHRLQGFRITNSVLTVETGNVILISRFVASEIYRLHVVPVGVIEAAA